MNKFSSQDIYFGTLLIKKNAKSIIYRENVCLIYDDKSDRFYLLDKTLNEFMDLTLTKNLSEEEKTQYTNTIKKYEYNYIIPTEDNEIYVDINSLKKLEKEVKNENTRNTRRK